ncbi:hypothetical protein [Marisediminitalea sp.]|uniref:hypothetical protein n=1 Tax=Marisediminitalea sp. TaxID=2662268 RepID=UPI003511CFE7
MDVYFGIGEGEPRIYAQKTTFVGLRSDLKVVPEAGLDWADIRKAQSSPLSADFEKKVSLLIYANQ